MLASDTASGEPLATSPPPRFIAIDLLILLAAAAILIAFRFHAFDLPLENDECNYAYIARRILSGDRLYVDVWDHQPFGVFAMLAAVIALFGDAPSVFRWTAGAFSLASLLLIYDIARRIARDVMGACAARIVNPVVRCSGALAALLFALTSSDPGTAGEGCQREIYMNTLILAAWWLGLRYQLRGAPAPPFTKGGLGGVLLAGVALGLASTLKTVVAVHWFLLAAWFCWTTLRPRLSRQTASTLAAFAIGPALIWTSAAIYFAVTNRWHEFLDAVFLFNLGYSESNGLLSRFAEFFAPLVHRFIVPMNPPPRFPFTFDSALPLWLFGLVGTAIAAIVCILRPRRANECGTGFQPVRNRGMMLLLALIAASYLATCLPSRFWPHYYYLMIPPLVLITATVPIALWQWWTSPTFRRLTMVLILTCVAFFQSRHYLSQPLFGLTVNRFNSRDFWGRAQGTNVASVTDPDDKIFVFGNDAEIYYYADRRCASRYTMITGLSAKLPGADHRRQILLDDLRRDPPRLILVLFDEDPFPQWLDFLHEHYGDPVGWDFHDRTHKPIAFILARKDRPIRNINWDWDRASVNGWAIGER